MYLSNIRLLSEQQELLRSTASSLSLVASSVTPTKEAIGTTASSSTAATATSDTKSSSCETKKRRLESTAAVSNTTTANTNTNINSYKNNNTLETMEAVGTTTSTLTGAAAAAAAATAATALATTSVPERTTTTTTTLHGDAAAATAIAATGTTTLSDVATDTAVVAVSSSLSSTTTTTTKLHSRMKECYDFYKIINDLSYDPNFGTNRPVEISHRSNARKIAHRNNEGIGLQSSLEERLSLQLNTNRSEPRKGGVPCSHLRQLVDKRSRTARDNLLKAGARMIDSTRYTGNATGYETKVMVFVLEYFEPFSSDGGGSALPTRYNKPILTVLGSAKKHMTAIGKAYEECAKAKRTDNFLYIPLIPDNNQTDLRLELQENKIVSDAAEDRIQPSLTPRPLDEVHNDSSFCKL